MRAQREFAARINLERIVQLHVFLNIVVGLIRIDALVALGIVIDSI